ncbi:MAG TPA: hypothetical protein EYH30_10565 [Anaerolineales bacterium]|nr:hypothetical protein [Anaerolineae bacterium]HIQ02543.1 hypothetical protein [Anaerolineales bacterium]
MRKWWFALVALAILFALPFLVIWPSLAGSWLLYRLFPAASPLLFWLYVPAFAVQILLSDPTRYLALSLSGLVLTTAALVWPVARWRRRVWRSGWLYLLSAALLAVVAFPLVVRYRPAVRAAPGAELRLVEPPGFLESPVRACQAAAEIRGCQYEVLGWADARTLVYRKWCGGYYDADGWHPGTPGPPRAYRLDLDTAAPFEGDVGGLSRELCLPSTCVHPGLAEVYAGGGYFPGQYGTPLLSPDGRRVAFTAWHIYGPEDLLVLSANRQPAASDR